MTVLLQMKIHIFSFYLNGASTLFTFNLSSSGTVPCSQGTGVVVLDRKFPILNTTTVKWVREGREGKGKEGIKGHPLFMFLLETTSSSFLSC